MKTVCRATLLGLPCAFALASLGAGCSGSGSAATGTATSAAIVTIPGVPQGIACIEVKVSGPVSPDPLFSATAGATEQYPINGLGAGANAFTAYAYPEACPSVQSTTPATWASTANETNLVAGQIAAVLLTLSPVDASTSGGSDGGTAAVADGGAASTGGNDGGQTMDASSPPPTDGSTVSVGPINLASSMIYSVYTPIFSSAGNLAAVTAKLPGISGLGFNVLYLLPVMEISTTTTAPSSSCSPGPGPSVGSPYSVKDYDSIEPGLGTSQDLVTLVTTAHSLGMSVVLDEVINHTAWDNALVTQHPEYYLHCDGNRSNGGSIEIGAPNFGNFTDTAQLDYKTTPDVGLRAYITSTLQNIITTYDIDGMRFDTADDPYGDDRFIPLDFWISLRAALQSTKPGFLMLGEEEDPDLDVTVFDLDYGWHLDGYYSTNSTLTSGLGESSGKAPGVAAGAQPATMLEGQWTWQGPATFPAGTTHMTILQDWDYDSDFVVYGGIPNTMAAATFDFTIDGTPMLFNGEEIGNDNSGFNTHTVIDWNSPNASTFLPFYTSLLSLRKANTALQGKGTLTWVTNSSPNQVASYTRSDSSGTFLVLINFSGGTQAGTVTLSGSSTWTDVSPTGSPGGTTHAAPPSFSLAAWDFAVFKAN